MFVLQSKQTAEAILCRPI